jgi:DNA-binding CsgD family transcriptional regulator
MRLLERDDELRELDLLLDEALGGGCGRVVLLEGPPGIGKTRLLEALRGRARERGATVLSARASELDRDFPFGVVRQLFEPLVAGAGGRHAGLFDGAAALARPLFDAGRGAAARDASTVELFHGLYWLTANLADQSPLLLAVDDVHWADAGSLRFLQFLVPRLEELPVLVALASRLTEPGFDRDPIDALATDPLAHVLRPRPLGESAVATLVSEELGAPPDPAFNGACAQATGGNPFLLRELLRELATDGVQPAAEATPLVSQLAPPTVARAVLLRLARLGDHAAALARALAILGDGAPLRRVAALAGLNPDHAAQAAEALVAAGILDTGAALSFAHPILRAVVYGEIGHVQRSRAHRQAAELLASEGAEPDAIAVHLLATEPSADADVVHTLREAAGRARSRGAAAAAAAFLRRAIEEPPPQPATRATLMFALASAELDAGDPPAAAGHFDEASRLTSDPRERASHVWEYAVTLQTLARYDEADALRERAAAEVADADPDLALQIEAGLIATAGLDLRRAERARERLESHRGRLTGATPAEQRLIATQAYYDAMHATTPAREVADAAERALSSGMLVDRATGFASTAFFSAIEALWLADRNEPARHALDTRIDDAQRRGSAPGFACLAGWRCMLLMRTGELEEAEADARSCAELALPHGLFALAPPMLGYVLTVYIERGLLDDAALLLDQAGVARRSAGDDLTVFPVLHARARLRAARGEMAQARADMDELARRDARWNSDLTLVPALLVAPELDDGRLDVGRMRAGAESWGTERVLGMALRAEALSATDTARRAELLEQAVDTLAGSPARLEHARALTDLGAAQRRVGGAAPRARETLREALDAADACGAPPLADRARAELRAAGARPRRPRISGVEALTPSERRIASMAADGLSNPEIAQALFVTKKTVEAHLGSAYRKLDINSRTQLAGALATSKSR